MFKKYLQNSKGLTLLELLAVVVILSIISVIAMIAVVNVIADMKKNAHIANATLLVNEAKKYIIAEKITTDDASGLTISLKILIDKRYIEPIKDPHSDMYYDENHTNVNVQKAGNRFTYQVTLVAFNNSHTYIDKRDIDSLARKDIKTP